ncbi:hypothetical protein F2P81_004503 [Scophthalmus maximus]|uniref:Uncharacterized protein n=1 Tax=Scophthalmus maximus TaxID=52904 RepID=A0A6A4T6F0_SCOMX|nr:hypothetical protein F2P81_004503 [Scophthalmus maximus]
MTKITGVALIVNIVFHAAIFSKLVRMHLMHAGDARDPESAANKPKRFMRIKSKFWQKLSDPLPDEVMRRSHPLSYLFKFNINCAV